MIPAKHPGAYLLPEK
jgi:hypothetical protein